MYFFSFFFYGVVDPRDLLVLTPSFPTRRSSDLARFEPLGVVAVVPPWNFPVAIPAGGMFAALAAGSAVLAKPAPGVPRCREVVVDIAHRAGIPESLLQLVPVPEVAVVRPLLTSVRKSIV